MNARRHLMPLIGTVGILALLAVATGPLVPHHAPGRAALRLAFRARPDRIEVCRAPTAEELEQVAAHMRQERICEGIAASYQLRVLIDDALLLDRTVRGGGLRHDRPVQVDLDQDVPPGVRRIQVSLTRREAATTDSTSVPIAPRIGSDTGLYAGRAIREAEERTRRDLAALPLSLTLDTIITVPTQRVLLVTFDPDTRAWRLHGAIP